MRGRLTMAILTAVVAAMGLIMMVFAVAGLQTVQWCKEQGLPIPWQAWAMLATVAVWCVIAANIPARRWKDVNRLLTRLTEE